MKNCKIINIPLLRYSLYSIFVTTFYSSYVLKKIIYFHEVQSTKYKLKFLFYVILYIQNMLKPAIHLMDSKTISSLYSIYVHIFYSFYVWLQIRNHRCLIQFMLLPSIHLMLLPSIHVMLLPSIHLILLPSFHLMYSKN